MSASNNESTAAHIVDHKSESPEPAVELADIHAHIPVLDLDQSNKTNSRISTNMMLRAEDGGFQPTKAVSQFVPRKDVKSDFAEIDEMSPLHLEGKPTIELRPSPTPSIPEEKTEADPYPELKTAARLQSQRENESPPTVAEESKSVDKPADACASSSDSKRDCLRCPSSLKTGEFLHTRTQEMHTQPSEASSDFYKILLDHETPMAVLKEALMK